MGTGLSLGIGIPFRRMGAGIDAQAQAHYNRVIADNGVIPSGLVGVNNFFKTVKAIYGTSDITTAISVGLDAQVLGYKLGAGAGTTTGQAAQKLYSCSGASGDVVQTTAASQPLLLVHEGANYWFGPNVNFNNCSTPNAAANQITGDLDIIAYLKHTSNGTLNAICSKNDNSNNRGYSLVFEANTLTLYYGTNSLNVASATSIVASGSKLWVRCTRNSSTGDIKFYTSNNPVTTAISSISWTQLGATVSGITGALNSSSLNGLFIGSYVSSGSGESQEQIYRVTLSNSIGGAPVVDFNPNQYNAATSQTQWTSTTGEVWTINTGTAATGYKGVLVDRTIVQGDGINDFLTTDAAITLITSYEQFASFNGFNNQAKYLLGVCDSGAAKNNYLIELSTNTINWAFGDGTNQRYGTNSFTYNSLNIANLQYIQGNNFISTKKNNGATITNTGMFGAATTIAGASARLSLFRAGEFNGAYANGIINTLLLSVNGTTQQQTDMYGYIKSINNNAF
jgi:hypothetical protein